MTESRPHRLEA